MVPPAACAPLPDGGPDLARSVRACSTSSFSRRRRSIARPFSAPRPRRPADRQDRASAALPPLLLRRRPMTNATERALVRGAHRARARPRLPRSRPATATTRRRSRRSARSSGCSMTRRAASGSAASAATCLPSRAAAAREPTRRSRAVLGAGRRAGVGRDRAPGAARGAPRRAVRSHGDRAARAAALRRAARARARARGRAGVLRARHAAAASRRPRVSGPDRLRARQSVGAPVRRIPVARSGAGRTAPPSTTTERVSDVELTKCSARWAIAPSVGAAATDEDTVDTRRAGHAGARAPSARRGNGSACSPSRASSPAASGGTRRLNGLDSRMRAAAARARAHRTRVAADRSARRARSTTSISSRRSRCRSCGLLAAWPAQATWAEWLDHFAALAPRVLRGPDRVLRVLADLRPMGAIGPVTLDEAARVLADRLASIESRPAGCGATGASWSPARRSCAAAASTSSSSRRWPSGCFRRSRARIRCCSTRRAAAARRRVLPWHAGRARRAREAAAAAGRRRRRIAAVRLVSDGGDWRRPAACAVVVRARGLARHDRTGAERRRAAAGGGAGVAGDAGVAGAGRQPRGDRRARARPGHAARARGRARPPRARAARSTSSS